MKLKTLKDWIATLPVEFEDMELVIGEHIKDDIHQYKDFSCRYDRSVMGLYVDEELKSVVFMYQDEDIDKIK